MKLMGRGAFCLLALKFRCAECARSIDGCALRLAFSLYRSQAAVHIVDEVFNIFETDLDAQSGAFGVPVCDGSIGRAIERDDQAFIAAP